MTVLDAWPIAAATSTTDVAVVAGSALMLGGLTYALDGVGGLRVTHQSDSIAHVPAGSTLIVIDLNGVAADNAFWQRLPDGARAVALCMPTSPPNLLTATRNGVHALVSRECDIAELLTAIFTAGRGGLHIDPDLFATMVQETGPADDGRRQQLTRREIEALQLIAAGFTHGQISRRMGLTEGTVSTYVKRIRHKLRVGNKAELTRRAIELGYVAQARASAR
jgi:two-component system invasion response regulator UvrY